VQTPARPGDGNSNVSTGCHPKKICRASSLNHTYDWQPDLF